MSPTMPTSDTMAARLFDLWSPVYLLLISLSCLPTTLISHPLLPLQPRQFQLAWFGNLWKHLGPQMALSPEQIPYISKLFGRAKGTVLELGPGTGDQMRHFSNTGVVQSGQVERVVGAEPNAVLHGKLKLNAAAAGLSPEKGRYIVLEAGAEPASLIPALHKARLYPTSTSEYAGTEGVFDTIMCVKSMCSAPQDQMREIVSTIQTLLKPGGEFLFFEHVANDQDMLTMAWAWLLGWIWPVAMGNCHLNGRVDKVVKEVGGWSVVDVRNTREYRGWNVFRYVVGVCKK